MKAAAAARSAQQRALDAKHIDGDLSAAATAENQNAWIALMKTDLAANYPKLIGMPSRHRSRNTGKLGLRPIGRRGVTRSHPTSLYCPRIRSASVVGQLPSRG